MGGLVIKKAYILARQFQGFEMLAHRVSTIFFLATPHRGSDLAQLLTKILSVASGARPFVTDLHRNSLATQSINDEFPHHCKDLQLYSFYETLPTSYGVGKSLIVDKDLATLGYPNERTAYLNANHRDICKYAAPTDPNYLTVRNALARAISSLRSDTLLLSRDIKNEQRRPLDNFLGVSDAPEDDFMDVDARRMSGSCEWLIRKENFHCWRDSENIQMYWISAKPGTGKSVLSGYIIKYLKDLNQDCSFYFFAHGNSPKSAIGSFLRSIAWQMAFFHPEALRTVLEVCEKDEQFSKKDYRIVWRKLFADGILRVKFDRPQYWVIDALDECTAESELIALLLKATELSPIRILVTSRNRFESHVQMVQATTDVVSEEIRAEDTNADISLYLEANMNHLPSVDEETRRSMVAQILMKSAGCFLWVSLVLQELKQVHTSTEIRQVLEDVPTDMDELYFRIVDSMSRIPHGKALAKSILAWTVCSARPLTTHELYHALQIDISDTIDNVQKSIIASCGQLVYVDAQSRVQMVHQTARDFLLRSSINSEFAVDEMSGHKRLAMTCLQYLNGSEMRVPRNQKLSIGNVSKERSPFVVYACNFFFEHVTHGPSTDDDVLVALARFLNSSNVLSWIEYLAQNSDLSRLIQTGKAFRNYLLRRSTDISPFSKEIALLDSWATDLVRLVTKFGKHLLESPSSIFHLIPPFCPPGSAPKKQFAASNRGIAILGLSAATWDDCLSTIVYQQEQASALACSDKYFAIGFLSGRIVIYHEMTCQEAHMLQNQEPVKILQFGETGRFLASSGAKSVQIWDITSWQQLMKFDIPQLCISLMLMGEDRLLLGALRNNQMMVWDLTTGLLKDSTDWTQHADGQRAHAFRRPTSAAFSTELGFLAVVYRGQDILLWDLERDALYETYGKETGARSVGDKVTNATVWSLVFSTAPTATLLAAAYSDGDLVLFDTSDGTVKETTLANSQTLACPPNGRTLASGDSAGTIKLFDFETLKLLYRISSEEYGIKAFAFSGDSHRLLDIRGSQCRVWDPIVLVRQNVDEHGDTVSSSTVAQESELKNLDEVILITALACAGNGEVIICAKEDGSVCLYDAKSGQQIQRLFSHADGVSVNLLVFDDESHTLSSADSSSRVMAHVLHRRQEGWKTSETIFDKRTDVAIHQLLSNKGHTQLLVSSANTDTLYSFKLNDSQTGKTITWKNRGPYRWGSHPARKDQIILMMNNVIQLYEWETLQNLTSPEGILLKGAILPELAIRSLTPCFNDTIIATKFAGSSGRRSESRLLFWSCSEITDESKTVASVPEYQYLADQVEFLIGYFGQRLVFLQSSGWVCSTDSETFNVKHHFFIPADWLSTNTDLMIEVSQNGDIVFVKRDEVAVIKRGLETSEQGPYNASGKKTTLAVPTDPESLENNRELKNLQTGLHI